MNRLRGARIDVDPASDALDALAGDLLRGVAAVPVLRGAHAFEDIDLVVTCGHETMHLRACVTHPEMGTGSGAKTGLGFVVSDALRAFAGRIRSLSDAPDEQRGHARARPRVAANAPVAGRAIPSRSASDSYRVAKETSRPIGTSSGTESGGRTAARDAVGARRGSREILAIEERYSGPRKSTAKSAATETPDASAASAASPSRQEPARGEAASGSAPRNALLVERGPQIRRSKPSTGDWVAGPVERSSLGGSTVPRPGSQPVEAVTRSGAVEPVRAGEADRAERASASGNRSAVREPVAPGTAEPYAVRGEAPGSGHSSSFVADFIPAPQFVARVEPTPIFPGPLGAIATMVDRSRRLMLSDEDLSWLRGAVEEAISTLDSAPVLAVLGIDTDASTPAIGARWDSLRNLLRLDNSSLWVDGDLTGAIVYLSSRVEQQVRLLVPAASLSSSLVPAPPAAAEAATAAQAGSGSRAGRDPTADRQAVPDAATAFADLAPDAGGDAKTTRASSRPRHTASREVAVVEPAAGGDPRGTRASSRPRLTGDREAVPGGEHAGASSTSASSRPTQEEGTEEFPSRETSSAGRVGRGVRPEAESAFGDGETSSARRSGARRMRSGAHAEFAEDEESSPGRSRRRKTSPTGSVLTAPAFAEAEVSSATRGRRRQVPTGAPSEASARGPGDEVSAASRPRKRKTAPTSDAGQGADDAQPWLRTPSRITASVVVAHGTEPGPDDSINEVHDPGVLPPSSRPESTGSLAALEAEVRPAQTEKSSRSTGAAEVASPSESPSSGPPPEGVAGTPPDRGPAPRRGAVARRAAERVAQARLDIESRKLEAARSNLRLALSLDPSNEEAKELMRTLARERSAP